MTENASNSFSRKNEKNARFPKICRKNASIIEKGLVPGPLSEPIEAGTLQFQIRHIQREDYRSPQSPSSTQATKQLL